MEEIITTASPRLYRSMVIGNESEGGMAQHFGRTSSNTFFQDYEDGSPFYYINQRIERIVGLKTTILDAAEDIQIANYGPGTFYNIFIFVSFLNLSPFSDLRFLTNKLRCRVLFF